MRRRVRNLEAHAQRVEAELREEVDRVRRSVRREMVVYQPPARALMPQGEHTVRVPIRRPQR